MITQRKTLWPGLICWLGFWGNLAFVIMLFFAVPMVLAEQHNTKEADRVMFQVLELVAATSVVSYWLVGKGYDWGRWLKLAANSVITLGCIYGAAKADNLRVVIVLIALTPLAWPLFLLLFFKRKQL